MSVTSSAALARRGGELAADPAGADDGHAAAVPEPLAQHVAVGERAQVVDPVELGARDLDPPRLGARGQQQPVVRQLAAVVERDPRPSGSIAVTVVPVISSISCSS